MTTNDVDIVSLSRRRGDTYSDVFEVTSKSTGAPMNIAGCSFLMTLSSKSRPSSSSNQLYQLVGVIIDSEKGLVSFSPSSAQANRVGKSFFDIQMTNSAGDVRTIASGPYRYNQDITK